MIAMGFDFALHEPDYRAFNQYVDFSTTLGNDPEMPLERSVQSALVLLSAGGMGILLCIFGVFVLFVL